MEENYTDFVKRVAKVSGNRNHRVSNSSGMAAAILFYNNNRPKHSSYVLTRTQYSNIVNEMNILMIDKLFKDKSFNLPCGLGELRISKRMTKTFLTDDDTLVCTKPIDMSATLKLWHEEPECYENRTVVRKDEDFVFRLTHSRVKATAKNAKYYYIRFGRSIKKKLRDVILNEKDFDTYERR